MSKFDVALVLAFGFVWVVCFLYYAESPESKSKSRRKDKRGSK
jgi:hypothetical protein